MQGNGTAHPKTSCCQNPHSQQTALHIFLTDITYRPPPCFSTHWSLLTHFHAAVVYQFTAWAILTQMQPLQVTLPEFWTLTSETWDKLRVQASFQHISTHLYHCKSEFIEFCKVLLNCIFILTLFLALHWYNVRMTGHIKAGCDIC